MDYFLWGYIKRKVYVRNYEKLDDLKISVTAVFQEVSREMFSSTMASFGKRLKRSLKFKVAISRTKYVFMIYIVLLCFPILSVVKCDQVNQNHFTRYQDISIFRSGSVKKSPGTTSFTNHDLVHLYIFTKPFYGISITIKNP